MKIGYIYVIINNINGKYYFGKTFNIKERWTGHLHLARKKINRKLYDAMNCYGYENFSIHKINEYRAKNKEILTKILNEKETYFISLTNSQKLGYNMSSGGDGGYLGVEAIQKMSIKKRGVPLSEEHKKRISQGNKGISKPVSIETRKKISETNKRKGIKWKPQYWGKEGYNNHPMLGKNHSEKSKKQMSEWRSGKTYEEIYGLEKTRELKDKKRKNWTGKNNPMYIELDFNHIKNIIKECKNLRELSEKTGIKFNTLKFKLDREYNTNFSKLKRYEEDN